MKLIYKFIELTPWSSFNLSNVDTIRHQFGLHKLNKRLDDSRGFYVEPDSLLDMIIPLQFFQNKLRSNFNHFRFL